MIESGFVKVFFEVLHYFFLETASLESSDTGSSPEFHILNKSASNFDHNVITISVFLTSLDYHN